MNFSLTFIKLYSHMISHIPVKVNESLTSSSTLSYLLGLSGLEPPTSRLSGARSNQLSYKPAGAESARPVFVVLEAVLFSQPSTVKLVRFPCLVIRLLGMEMMGFEPMTPCLQGRCSPN